MSTFSIIALAVGCFMAGGFVGVTVMALMAVASDDDERNGRE